MIYPLNKIKHELENVDDWFQKLLIIFLFIFLFCSTFSIALTQIAYFTAIFFWLLIILKHQKPYLNSTPMDIYFLLFILAEIISTLFSKDIAQSLYYLHKRVIIIPIIYLIYSWIRTRERLETSVIVLFSSILLISLYGCYDIILNLNDYLHFERRLNLTSFYMTAGGLLMISSLMLLSYITHQGTPRAIKVFSSVAFIFSIICLIFTFTRGSWLGFIAGSILISFQRSKIIFAMLIFVLIFIILISPVEIKDRIYSIIDPYHPNNVERLQMWLTGIKIFYDNPIVGIGDIGTEEVYKIYGPPDSNPVGHLHNNFINILVKLGIIGLIIFLILFLRIFVIEIKSAFHSRNDWLTNSVILGAAASLVAFHINGLFEWNFGDTEVIMFLWITVGLALSANFIYISSKSSNSII